MAVQNNLQGKGIGASLMNFAENVARDQGYKKLIMHARKTAIGFYEKLGYKVSGDEFIELSIPHYIMEKKLTLLSCESFISIISNSKTSFVFRIIFVFYQ